MGVNLTLHKLKNLETTYVVSCNYRIEVTNSDLRKIIKGTMFLSLVSCSLAVLVLTCRLVINLYKMARFSSVSTYKLSRRRFET